ncbi:MAG: cation:proton antiporter [Anaerolineae bacterium]|nr:cation:proton antiporter [Anaerolineae bacterium]
MNIIEVAFFIIIPILSLAMILAFVRVLRGPSLPDRVVGLDLLATLGVGIIAVYAVVANQPVFLDVAVVLALLAFLGTVAFAYYIQRRA